MRQMYRKFEVDKNLVTCLPFKQIDVYQSTVSQQNAAQYPIPSHIVLNEARDLTYVDLSWI